MELINNVGKTLRDDMTAELHNGSKLSIAASCFSIYAFQELKEALKDIKELRFIFTSPTFTTERTPKQQREFYIPRLDRERTLYGSEFEVKLRNELTQKAIAKECAEWIRQKACFKSNRSNEQMMGFVTLDETSYAPMQVFRQVVLTWPATTTPIVRSVITTIRHLILMLLTKHQLHVQQYFDVVNIIRQHPDEFPEWHSFPTAELYSPTVFENKKKSGGYWF